MRRKKVIFLLFFSLLLFFIPATAQAKGVRLPLSGGYSTLGLWAAGAVMEFFRKSYLYRLVVMIGFLALLYRGVTARDFKPFIIYVIIVLVCTSLFIMPRAQRPLSFKMNLEYYQEKGIKLNKEMVARLKSLEEQSTQHAVPLGLMWLSGVEDKLVDGIGNALDITTGKEGERFGEGLLFAKLQLQSHLDNIVITDTKLDADYRDFANGPYALALVEWENDRKKTVAGGKVDNPNFKPDVYPYWPGHPAIKYYYDKVGSNVEETWGALSDRVYKDIVNQTDQGLQAELDKLSEEEKYGWATRVRGIDPATRTKQIERRKKSLPSSRDALIFEALHNSELDVTQQGMEYVGELQKEVHFGPLVQMFATAGAWLASAFIMGALDAFPMIQAYVLYATLALFPLVLLIAFLPFEQQQIKILFMYFLSLFWVKSWLWGFILAHNFSNVAWFVGTEGHEPIGAGAMLYFVTTFMIIITPVFTYGLIFKGGLTIATAVGAAVASIAAGAQAMFMQAVSYAKKAGQKAIGLVTKE